MCASVIIDGHLLESQGELKTRLGPLIYLSYAPQGAKDDDDGCLCLVDVPAMAEREGMVSKWDGMDWVLHPASEGRKP